MATVWRQNKRRNREISQGVFAVIKGKKMVVAIRCWGEDDEKQLDLGILKEKPKQWIIYEG